MAQEKTASASSAEVQPTGEAKAETAAKRRSIPGDFSYTPTYGKLKTALENIIKAERPEVFNKDFIATYLGVSGGSATPIPPILRRMGFLGSDNRPTELYAKFQNENQRPAAALEGLKRAFAELFKKNTYAHSLNEDEIKNTLVEITGLKKNDTIISQIYGTFEALRHYVPKNFTGSGDGAAAASSGEFGGISINEQSPASAGPQGFGLSYHINIVLPETKDVAVFNAIFQSLKQNLLS